MRAMMISGALLLAASAATAGMNAGLSPFVHVSGAGASGTLKDAPYVEVHVGATGIGSVNAVHVDVEYDPSGLELVDFRAGDLFGDPVVLGPFDRKERHVVDVTTATLSGAVSASEAEVGVVRFRVLDDSRAGVRVVSFQTGDANWEVETQVSYANPVSVSPVPRVTRLVGNAPNPFNPVTEIRFDLSERGPVSVEVYNVSGRRVRTLLREVRSAGTHTVLWDGTDESGTSVSSGVYFYRLQAGEYSASKRMTLIR